MAGSVDSNDDVLSEINITPLVDVMLVLLVAFILTIPVLSNAIHINLPKTTTTTPPDQQKSITVTVDSSGAIYFDNAIVSIEELDRRLLAARSNGEDPSLHLRADERVSYGPVAKVMATIEHAGITRVSVLTDQQ